MSFKESFLNNPTCSFFIGLGPIIAISTTLEHGLIYSISFLCVFFLSAAIVPIIKILIPLNLRHLAVMSVVASISIVTYFLSGFYNMVARENILVWLFLFAVHAIMSGHLTRIANDSNFSGSFMNAAGSVLSYTIFLVVFSGVREILASGTLTVRSGLDEIALVLPSPEWLSFGFFALVPGGFILIGYVLALYRLLKNDSVGVR